MKKDVAIVMINYNTYEFTRNAINGLFKYTTDLSYELILVDNKSPDGSGEKLKEEFGDKIKYIQSGANLGTSKAFNMGLSQADAKYVLWLNTDVIFTQNFIKDLFDFMESNPTCGVCGGNLIGPNGEPSHAYRKKMMTVKTIKRDNNLFVFLFRKIFKKGLSENYNYTSKPKEVGLVIGADMFVRKEIFDKLGGLEESIFMYGEETEFQYRVKTQTDYNIMSVPNAKLVHLEGGSISGKSFSERRQRFVLEGTGKFVYKSYGEKALRKYLKNCYRDYSKFVFIFSLFFMRDKVEIYKKKRAIAKELINNVDSIFKGNK